MVSAQAQAINNRQKDEYEVLRSFFEWRRTQGEELSDRNGQLADRLHAYRPTMSPELSMSPNERASMTPIASNKRPIATRIFRTIVYGVIVALLVFVGWQAYRDEGTKEAISAWWRSSAAWLSFLDHQSPISAKGGTAIGSRSSDRAGAAVSSSSAEATEAGNFSHEIQQQLQTIASDLAIVRRTVEQLASKQEQMAQEIASLQAAQQNASKTVSSIAQSVTRIQRSTAQNVMRSERGQQPAPAPSIVSQSANGNASGANAPPAQ